MLEVRFWRFLDDTAVDLDRFCSFRETWAMSKAVSLLDLFKQVDACLKEGLWRYRCEWADKRLWHTVTTMFCVFCAQRFVPSQRRSDSFPASTRSWSNYVCNLKRLNMLRILSDKDLDSSGTISLEEWVEALVQIRLLAALNWQDRSSQTFCAFCDILFIL